MYLSQLSNLSTPKNYALTAAYIEGIDEFNLLDKFIDDGAYGCIRIRLADNFIVCRDQLDSILELYFLIECLQLKESDTLKLIDIGAGYGRFAHRFVTTFPNAFVYAADAVPHSTFFCDYYMQYRGITEKVKPICIYDLTKIDDKNINIATNIHSWSECPIEAIEDSVRIIKELGIDYLFFVPHSEPAFSLEINGSHKLIEPVFKKYGFNLVTKRKKFHKSRLLDLRGIFNSTYHLYKCK